MVEGRVGDAPLLFMGRAPSGGRLLDRLVQIVARDTDDQLVAVTENAPTVAPSIRTASAGAPWH